MPTVEIAHNPQLTKEELAQQLRQDTRSRYRVFLGGWYQGKSVIAGQNDWVGVAVNIRQKTRQKRTFLEVKSTVPNARCLLISLMVLFGAALALIASIRNNFYPLIVLIVYSSITLAAGFYWNSRSQLASTEIAGLLEISDLASPRR